MGRGNIVPKKLPETQSCNSGQRTPYLGRLCLSIRDTGLPGLNAEIIKDLSEAEDHS